MFFSSPPTADDQSTMREILSYLSPKSVDDVRMVAAALRTDAAKYESVFLEWAAPFGRYKAKGLWVKVRPDPDALEEVFARQVSASQKRTRFKPETAHELPQQSNDYRIKGLLPAFGIAVVYGPSGSGKSFLVIAIAASIAEGDDFFGHRTKAAPVLIVALEGEAGIPNRVRAWESQRGRRFPSDLRFMRQPFVLTNANDVNDLAAICPPGCVIFIDTLNRAAPGMDENSSKDMGAAIEGAKTLQRLTGGLVILVAHTGKDATKGLRGHSSLFAALDAALLVSRDGRDRRWKVDKSKDGSDGAEHGFQLKVIALGSDYDGDLITSCVVEPEALAVYSTASRPLSQNQRTALAAYHDAARRAGKLGSDGSFAGLHVDDWRQAFYQSCTADNDDAKRKAFLRARADLVERNKLSVANDLYRLSGEHAAATEALIISALNSAGTGGTEPGLFTPPSRVPQPP